MVDNRKQFTGNNLICLFKVTSNLPFETLKSNSNANLIYLLAFEICICATFKTLTIVPDVIYRNNIQIKFWSNIMPLGNEFSELIIVYRLKFYYKFQ